MKLRLAALLMALAVVGAFVLAPLSAEAKAAQGTATLTDPATGQVLGTVTKLVATFDPVTGVTTVSGKFKDTAGKVTKFATTLVSASGTCPILHLELGPLDLNLLGLVVHLDRVVLDITAVPGAGNLLGNLLCAVAGLLDNPSGLANLLNQIFALLK